MSAETERLFRRLLKDLRPLFRENGFRASSQNFILESAECWVVINFQKSRWAAVDETTFYVNVAASAKRWLGFYGKPADKTPSYCGCDWRWRLEFFCPDDTRQQWTLGDENSLQQTLTSLRSLSTMYLIPATRMMTTEADLLKQKGGFQYPQTKTRTIIFAATNQIEALRESVANLREKFTDGPLAQETQNHLEYLYSTYPDVMRQV